MKVKVQFTIEIDENAYAAEYGIEKVDAAVRGNIREELRQTAEQATAAQLDNINVPYRFV
jgi:hypothetical protein